MQIRPIKNFTFEGEVLSDRAITHRALILLSLAKGIGKIKNPLITSETQDMINALQQVGADISINSRSNEIIIGEKINLRDNNDVMFSISATAVKLLIGALSGRFFNFTFKCDGVLKNENFIRAITPMIVMGGNVVSEDGKLPIEINPASLKGVRYDMICNDADVKGSILLAGLTASGPIILNELAQTKNHTEIMMQYLDANIKIDGKQITMVSSDMVAKDIYVPGDITLAAYIIGLGILCGRKEITINNLGANATRNFIIKVLDKFGIKMRMDNIIMKNGEPVADLVATNNTLEGLIIKEEMLPKLIDELPLIMTIACFAEGETIIEGINKKFYEKFPSFRVMQESLSKMGADISVNPNSIRISGKKQINGGVTVDCARDYRVAMGLAICGAKSKDGCYINDFDCVGDIYPTFKELLI